MSIFLALIGSVIMIALIVLGAVLLGGFLGNHQKATQEKIKNGEHKDGLIYGSPLVLVVWVILFFPAAIGYYFSRVWRGRP